MTLDKRTRERLLAHCGELHEDDGVDPRRFFKIDKRRNKQNHKARQLCHQVAETLALVLAGEFGDHQLHGLQVVSVDPAPDASQLSVTLRTDEPCGSAQRQEVLNRLAMVNGRLRCAVAAAISRKRTPKLLFRIVGPADERGEVQP